MLVPTTTPTTMHAPCPGCPAGLPQDSPLLHCDAQFGSCYIYQDTVKMWSAQSTTCKGLGGGMVSWNSLAEQSSVEAYFAGGCLH